MSYQLINLIGGRNKSRPNDLCIMGDEIRKFELIVIDVFKWVNFDPTGKTLVDLLLGDVLELAGLILHTNNKSH